MQEAHILKLAQSLLYDRAMVSWNGEWVGAIAAIPKASLSKAGGDLNYSEIFIRDNVPVMVYLLLQKKYAAVKNFLTTCLSLQSQTPQTRGIFPTSFVEHDGVLVADYGQRAIGRVISVDATLWWVVLANAYVKHSGDRDWAAQPNVQSGIQKFLDLILRPSFRDAPTLYVPDGAFMIDRPLDVWGAPLEIQALLYGALRSAAALLTFAGSHSQPHTPHDCLSYARVLRRHLLKHYWVTSKTVQVLRRRPTEQYGTGIQNEFNIQTETIPHWLQEWLGDRGGYLIGNIRTGRPDFRFFSLGNCLGAIFDVISPNQQQSLFRLVMQNQQHLVAQMPLRICHPPLEDTDWRKKTGYDRKNLPWCYHNGGHWASLTWFLCIAMQRQNHSLPEDLKYTVKSFLNNCYDLMLRQLPDQQWAEYHDGPTAYWIGQQARTYQTWTIVGLLLMQHFVNAPEGESRVLDLGL